MISAMDQCAYDVYFAHEHMVSGSNSSIDYFVVNTSYLNLVVPRTVADQINMNDWSNLAKYRFASALEAGFRRICQNRGITPDITNYYNRADTVLLAVNSGVGISILPASLVEFYSLPNIVAFPIESGDALLNSIIGWNHSGSNPEVARFLSVSRLAKQSATHGAPSP